MGEEVPTQNKTKPLLRCKRGREDPTNNALLINFLLSSDAEILLISADWACKSAPNVQKRVSNVCLF